jgi:hypothetical protein
MPIFSVRFAIESVCYANFQCPFCHLEGPLCQFSMSVLPLRGSVMPIFSVSVESVRFANFQFLSMIMCEKVLMQSRMIRIFPGC